MNKIFLEKVSEALRSTFPHSRGGKNCAPIKSSRNGAFRVKDFYDVSCLRGIYTIRCVWTWSAASENNEEKVRDAKRRWKRQDEGEEKSPTTSSARRRQRTESWISFLLTSPSEWLAADSVVFPMKLCLCSRFIKSSWYQLAFAFLALAALCITRPRRHSTVERASEVQCSATDCRLSFEMSIDSWRHREATFIGYSLTITRR